VPRVPRKRVFVGIPILNRADLLERCLDHIDHPAQLLVVDNNSVDRRFDARLRRLARERGFELARQPRNLGVAASWNLIVRTGIARGFDLVFIGSNDTFLHPGSLAAVLELEKPDDEVVWHLASWNFFAIHRRAIDRVGWFDENFYPAYKEDQDYAYRCSLAGVKRIQAYFTGAGAEHLGSQTIHSDAHYFACNRHTHLRLNMAYYRRKWGGNRGCERYVTPFGRADRDWRWWPPPGAPAIARRDWDRDRRPGPGSGARAMQ
jgi:GT2 family glycosyltransferase